MSSCPCLPCRFREDVATALRAVPTDAHGRLRACPHLPAAAVLTGIPQPGMVCVTHPDRVRCVDCTRRHAARHGWEHEHTCNVCNGVVDTIAGTGFPAAAPLASLTGETVQTFVVGVGLGVCRTCFEQEVAS